MTKEAYIQGLSQQDRSDLLKALTAIRDKFHKYRNSPELPCPSSLIEAIGTCTAKLSFIDGTTRVYFNATGISNKNLAKHIEIMSKEEGWKNYLQKLEDQDCRDLFSSLAILQGDFHMYRGVSPSRCPPFLLKNAGKCRAMLDFRTGVTEISFNLKTISNSELDGFVELVAQTE